MADELEKLFGLMEARKNFAAGVGASVEEVKGIESSLNIVLPESYRRFLQKYGWAKWFGRSIYGAFVMPVPPVGHDVDTIRKTMKVRHTEWPAGFERVPLKGNVLYFSNEVIFLNSADSDRPGVVADLDYDEGQGSEAKSWPSFESYLEEVLKY